MYTPAETGQQPAPSAALLCYVTDRRQFQGSAQEQERRLLEKIAECAAAGVDLVQLREKDLSSRDLLALAQKTVACLPPGAATRLLVNARTDIALASGAHGVHLPAGDLPASEARAIWGQVTRTHAVVGFSAHTPEEVALVASHGADFALFAPVFEKEGRSNPRGLVMLREACQRSRRAEAFMPVLALGGITLENAATCFVAGASGVAAIRLFQQNPAAEVVNKLRLAFSETKTRAMYRSR
jgi:thiamine-phosphate pyrophosphorylase